MKAKRILLTIVSASLAAIGIAACAVEPGMLAGRDTAVEVGTSYIVQADSASSPSICSILLATCGPPTTFSKFCCLAWLFKFGFWSYLSIN